MRVAARGACTEEAMPVIGFLRTSSAERDCSRPTIQRPGWISMKLIRGLTVTSIS
jgi:hypothetical protein